MRGLAVGIAAELANIREPRVRTLHQPVAGEACRCHLSGAGAVAVNMSIGASVLVPDTVRSVPANKPIENAMSVQAAKATPWSESVTCQCVPPMRLVAGEARHALPMPYLAGSVSQAPLARPGDGAEALVHLEADQRTDTR